MSTDGEVMTKIKVACFFLGHGVVNACIFVSWCVTNASSIRSLLFATIKLATNSSLVSIQYACVPINRDSNFDCGTDLTLQRVNWLRVKV